MSNGKIVWDAPEDMTELKVEMKSGSEVKVVLTGYADELEMLTALRTIGSIDYIAKLACEINSLYDDEGPWPESEKDGDDDDR
jgi:hypothetical protein